MADSTDPRDTSIPSQASNNETAEGARANENVESGITNRPIEEEQREKQDLPPREKSRDEVDRQ